MEAARRGAGRQRRGGARAAVRVRGLRGRRTRARVQRSFGAAGGVRLPRSRGRLPVVTAELQPYFTGGLEDEFRALAAEPFGRAQHLKYYIADSYQ